MRHNEVERVADYLKQSGLLVNWQRIEVSYRDPRHAVATVQYADSEPRRWHVVSYDGFTNEELWKVYEEIVTPDSPADHVADFGGMVETRWISASESLPKVGEPVLCCWSRQKIGMGVAMRRDLWGKVAWTNVDQWDEIDEPIAWMPLPEPPEVTP